MPDAAPEPRTRPRLSGRAVQPEAALPELSRPEQRPCSSAENDEPMGGDPPCWAHLFEDDADADGQ